MNDFFAGLFGMSGGNPSLPVAWGPLSETEAQGKVVWNPTDEVTQVKWNDPPPGGFQEQVRKSARPGLPGVDVFPEDATDVPTAVKKGAPSGRVHTQTGGAFAPEDVLKVPDLDISYIGDKDNPYGRDATRNAKPFNAIVFHYTGSDGPVMNSAQYGQRVDPKRGGQFGYHYYIDKDGAVIQGAPLSKRTNHVKPNTSLGVTNSNAIGISLAGSGEKPTEAQIAAARKLVDALRGHYSISSDRLYGHGEVNSHKDHREGSTLVRLLRGK